MMIIWGLNGYFQSMGWVPTVKTDANWVPLEKRGKMGFKFHVFNIHRFFDLRSSCFNGRNNSNGFWHQESSFLCCRFHRLSWIYRASLTGIGSGWLADKFGWNASFYFWVVGAVLAALLMSLLWKHKPEKGTYH